MTNSEYLFKAALKAKKPIFFSFQTSPSAEWWGLERATGAYLGGFYEIFQNDLILLWALLMNGNPIWPQYLGTQSQCWERLTTPTPNLSKPLPPRRRSCGALGSSRETSSPQDCLLARSGQNGPTPAFPGPGPPHSILGWGVIGSSGLVSVGRLRGKEKSVCYTFRQVSQMWRRPKKQKRSIVHIIWCVLLPPIPVAGLWAVRRADILDVGWRR